jgi:hypothetical protein
MSGKFRSTQRMKWTRAALDELRELAIIRTKIYMLNLNMVQHGKIEGLNSITKTKMFTV